MCSGIPACSREFWKGGDLQTDALPSASLTFEIVGAPFFDDTTDRTHHCLKRCPECGTIYRWEMEYEYLVNGSEDDISLTRLSDEEGQVAAQDALETINKAREHFMEQSKRILDELERGEGWNRIRSTSSHFSYHWIKGFDIGFAMPRLVEALARHPHAEKDCPGTWLCWLIKDYALRTPGQARSIRAILDTCSPGESPEIEQLIADLPSRNGNGA